MTPRVLPDHAAPRSAKRTINDLAATMEDASGTISSLEAEVAELGTQAAGTDRDLEAASPCPATQAMLAPFRAGDTVYQDKSRVFYEEQKTPSGIQTYRLPPCHGVRG